MKKKTGLFLLLLITSASTLAAQDYERSIGLRLGTVVGGSYKQFLHTAGALEAILDLDIVHQSRMSVRGTVLYEYHFPIRAVDGLAWYIGAGITAGAKIGDTTDKPFLFGADVLGGVEYKLMTLPLCFAFDFDPKLYFIGYDTIHLDPSSVGLTMRYTF
ncbi:MAG: hypothetical protein LBF81_02950 [Prevotellaceae bacterium]|jgi:hypothetical protein|nr:hypothetical protein [Prevotellaceae bacterium]